MALSGAVGASVAKGQLACEFLEVKKVAIYMSQYSAYCIRKICFSDRIYKQLVGPFKTKSGSKAPSEKQQEHSEIKINPEIKKKVG